MPTTLVTRRAIGGGRNDGENASFNMLALDSDETLESVRWTAQLAYADPNTADEDNLGPLPLEPNGMMALVVKPDAQGEPEDPTSDFGLTEPWFWFQRFQWRIWTSWNTLNYNTDTAVLSARSIAVTPGASDATRQVRVRRQVGTPSTLWLAYGGGSANWDGNIQDSIMEWSVEALVRVPQ